MPTGNLPASGKKLFEEVYDKALKGSCKGDKECAARTAWSSVKGAGWSKDKDGNWSKKSDFQTFSLSVTRASYDKVTNEMRWKASASDTEADLYDDNMSLELFEDFIDRIDSIEPAPEDFRSRFWVGGMPYLSVSHYPDLDGKAVPGTVESVFIDGNFLKSEGKFNDTPLGRASFRSVNEDLYGKNKEGQDKVRISIAFIDWKHKHKDTQTIFERKSLDDMCPECFKNMITDIAEGNGLSATSSGAKEFLRGQLIHLAMTRVPVNTRTLMEVERAMKTRKEDAESIVGEELAKELEEEAGLVGKSQALVIKAEDDMSDCAEGESEEDCRKRLLTGKIADAEPGMELVPTKADMKEEDEEEDEEEDKKKKKVKEEEEKSEAVPDNPISLAEMLAEIKSLLTIKPEPHILDGAFAELKAQFDVQLASGATEDEILHSLQEPYSMIGEAIKSAIKPKDGQPTPDNTLNILTQTVQQLAQQVNLISTKLDGVNKAPAEAVNPPRRSISASLVLQKSQVDTAKSSTPRLRDIINRTT
jgi:cation transport regulator ChaB